MKQSEVVQESESSNEVAETKSFSQWVYIYIYIHIVRSIIH